MTLVAVFNLLVIFGASRTAAQARGWGATTSAAAAASQRGDYTLAQTLYKQAIEIQVKTLGADNPEVAITLNNLAVSYQDQSKYAQAEQAYRQALAILEKDPRQKVATGFTLNNLAALFHEQDMDAEAESLYTRALTIWGKLAPKQSANEAITAT